MQRTAQISEKPTWRKISQGTLYPFPSKRNFKVKFKQLLQATVEELGNKINQFELVTPGSGVYKVDVSVLKNQQEPEQQKEEQKQPSAPSPDKETYAIEHVGGGWYNVKSSTGKVMNEQKLRSTDAEALKQTLEEETRGDE